MPLNQSELLKTSVLRGSKGWKFKDLACANKLEDNIENVVKEAEKILIAQNDPASDLHLHVSKKLMTVYLGQELIPALK